MLQENGKGLGVRMDTGGKGSRLFRYYPSDFGDLTVRVIHMNLFFDVFDDHTVVSSKLDARVLDRPIRDLVLNAKELEILSVSCDASPVTFAYDRDSSLLTLSFGRELPPGTSFVISTETICYPSDHVLEGLYYDRTPAGAPPTQISQCQQWGFQRLVPCIDTMDAKCTYTTTIVADERYTSLLSNGDVTVPRTPVGNGRVSISYANDLTPMAPYLFFLGVGNWEIFSRDFEYPNGKEFRLELLVPPGSDAGVAGYALQVLAGCVLWVYLFTGPEQFTDREKREQIVSLVRERDLLKSTRREPERLILIREKIRSLCSGLVTGYQYTGTVYREIGMQNSDFGGMENVGNTTIAMNRIMPYPQMTDPSFEYMIRVKVHEFYHNLNGSEVTGKTPFELWLNEAVTAFVENAYHAYLFGESYNRQGTVLNLYAPSTGTFALDAGSASMPIEPDGFNDPNDLITGITYVKAAEFVRMIETLAGKEAFVRGLDLYHTRYRHKNATWRQWIEAMEEVSGQEFSSMAGTWLKQTGFPVVSARGSYDETSRRFVLSIRQQYPDGGSPWTLPFSAALVDARGKDLAVQLQRLDLAETSMTFENVERPAFLSLCRGCSFYGKVETAFDPEALRLQALLDSDRVNRFLALYRLAEHEITALMDNPGREPSKDFADLYYRILTDETLSAETGGLLLTLYDTVDVPGYAHRYRALFMARRALENAVALRHHAGLVHRYRRHERPAPLTTPLDDLIPAVKERQVRNTCLSLLSTLDTSEVHGLIRSQIDGWGVATDRLRAFSLYLNSSAGDRLAVMESFGTEAAKHPVSWESYLAVVGGCSAPDAVGIIRKAAASPHFQIKQVNDHRALYGSFAANRKVSLETAEGRELLREVILELAPVNQNSTVSLLRAFGAVDQMDAAFHLPLVGLLAGLKEGLSREEVPVVWSTIRRLIAGAPKARQAYEAEYGPVPGMDEIEKP
jgi:aminopeptidase N